MNVHVQNDWDVVEAALRHPAKTADEWIDQSAEAADALARLREFTAFMIQSLNARVTELEAELALRAPAEGWPEPAPLPPDYWESAQ